VREIVVRALLDQGVTTLFGYPAAAVLPIYDAMHQDKRHGESCIDVLVRHEQGAAHAAEGYARATRQAGRGAGDALARRDQHGHGHCRRARWTQSPWSS
jgi:thiamine pyrophosphate-dependent acetolactate synthase large subunit-like protein